jgi:hypothetical protein
LLQKRSCRLPPINFPCVERQRTDFAGHEKIPQDGARHSFASHWLPVNDSNFGQPLIYMGHFTIQVLMAHYRRHATEEVAAKYWEIKP